MPDIDLIVSLTLLPAILHPLVSGSLTRRFSVLRNSSGDPIGVDDLKHKFAEQRARGAEHQVTEEEEDMILEALGRIRTSRTKHADSVNGDGNGNGIGAQALASPLSPYSPTGPGNGSHSIHSPYRTPSAQGGYSETGHSHGQSHQGGIPPPSPASYTPQSQQYQNQQNATHQGQSQGVYTGSTSTGISVSNAWSHTPAQTSVVQGYGR